MANLPALSVNGEDTIFFMASGEGTGPDPFVVRHAIADGDGNEFSSLPVGANLALTVALVDENGDQILNFGGDASAANQTAGNIILASIDTRLSGTLAVEVGNFPGTFSATQSGAWTVVIDNFPVTQPISATALPLPDQAATSTNQATIIGHVDGIESLLAGTLVVDTGLSPLTDTQLRADPVPASVAELPSISLSPATAPTLTSVASSATSVTLLAANTNRKLAVIVNDSTANLYVKFDASAASTANYSVLLYPGGQVHLKGDDYAGEIRGIWASANGFARVTEVV